MSTNHPARSTRQIVGAASIAAFVGAAIGIASHGHSGTTQPAGASQTPATTPATNPGSADDGNWGATTPDDGQFGSGQFGNGQQGSSGFGAGGSDGGSSHSQSGAS